MKTMKKSKVIVPALGLLLLSTAASITGTVAWFTATKEISATAGNFAVASTTGDLELTATAGYGTALSTDSSLDEDVRARTITPAANCVLADASYDHLNDVVYMPYSNGTKVKAHKNSGDEIIHAADAASVANAYIRQTVGSVKKHSAFTWTYTFKFTPESDDVNLALFLDTDTTKSSVADKAPDNNSNSYLGFRLAFITSTKQTVWAANRDASACKYISAEGTLGSGSGQVAGTAYQQGGAKDLIASDTTASIPDDGVNNAAASLALANCLGTFDTARDSDGKVSIEVLCVAWFEGTDPMVSNNGYGTNKALDSVLATMTFDAVNLA